MDARALRCRLRQIAVTNKEDINMSNPYMERAGNRVTHWQYKPAPPVVCDAT